MLERRLLKLTWIAVIVFLPIETWLCWQNGTFLESDYLVNVTGAGILLWAALALGQGRHYATGLLATGWAWMTAVCWRATNARYWFAAEGDELAFGDRELWIGPLLTVICAAVLAASIALLIRRDRKTDR